MGQEPCAWCKRPINYGTGADEEKLHHNSKYAPTVDHVEGVANDPFPPMDRLVPMHRGCNAAKSNRAIARSTINGQQHQAPNVPESSRPEYANPTPAHPAHLGFNPPDEPPPPRLLTQTTEDQHGLANEWIEWVEANRRIKLRPWQKITARTVYATTEGSLQFNTVLVSTPRQMGKGIWMMAFAPARVAHPDHFGEPQVVIQSANNLNAAIRMHEPAWEWANERGLHVRRAMGNCRITWPDGSYWGVSSLKGINGLSASTFMLDEAWDVEWSDVHSGAIPILAARKQSQLVMLSTADMAPTKLMPFYRARAMAAVDPRLALVEWSADPADDLLDPMVWWKATPQWTTELYEQYKQHAEIDFDAFKAQRLNIWPTSETDKTYEWPTGWSQCPKVEGSPPPGGTLGVDESGDRSYWGMAYAVPEGEGVKIWTARTTNFRDAVKLAREWEPETVLAGITVAADWQYMGDWQLEKAGTRQTYSGTPWLQKLVNDGQISHDHSEVVAAQTGNARIAETERGDMLSQRKSVGPIETLKVTAWAAQAAREHEPIRVRIY